MISTETEGEALTAVVIDNGSGFIKSEIASMKKENMRTTCTRSSYIKTYFLHFPPPVCWSSLRIIELFDASTTGGRFLLLFLCNLCFWFYYFTAHFTLIFFFPLFLKNENDCNYKLYKRTNKKQNKYKNRNKEIKI